MKWIVDRIEGHLAVCEKPDKSMENIELDQLPSGVKAGDVLTEKNGVFKIDSDETKQRKERINSLMKDMWE